MISVLFWSFFTVQILYALFFILNFKTKSKINIEKKPLSIIICNKNGEAFLKENIEAICTQQYHTSLNEPLFEVLVCDDYSTDNSWAFLETLNYKHLNILKNPNKTGKKQALQHAISNCKYEHLVLTDVDCTPLSKYWLQEINQHFNGDILLLLSPYQRKRKLINLLIQFETAITAIQYISFANAGIAYMGVGRNLAYTKSVFEKLACDDFFKLPYGDDDLLISKAQGKYSISTCISSNSFMLSHPEENFLAWIKQKQRHTSTGKYYPFLIKIFLALLPLSFLFFFLFGIMNYLFIPILLRYLCFGLVYYKLSKTLNSKMVFINFIFLEWVWLAYLFIVSPYILFKNKLQWT